MKTIIAFLLVGVVFSAPVVDVYFSQYAGQKVISLAKLSSELVEQTLLEGCSTCVYDEMNGRADGTVSVRVNPAVLSVLDHNSVEYTVEVDDVAGMVKSEREHIAASKAKMSDAATASMDEFYEDYRDLDDLVARYTSLAQQYSSIFRLGNLSRTVENRDILIGVIALDPANPKPIYFVESTQHAREWVATMTMCYIIEMLLINYEAGDPQAWNVLHSVDVHFIPIVNVDGFQYAWTNDRLWRKNRAFNYDGTRGVDLNRNWDTAWCTAGSSTQPNSDTYCGPFPFSEPETTASSNYQFALGSREIIAVDIHTYGSLILRPYQVNNSLCPDEARNQAAGAVIQEAIESIHGMTYDNIRGIQLYAHSGGFVDWTYQYITTNPRPFSFTMELRGNSFSPPPDQIILACEENYAGQMALVEYVVAL